MANFSLEFDSEEERNLLYEAEKALILLMLKINKGNRMKTAKVLGCGIRTLQRKIKDLQEGGEEVTEPYNRFGNA